MSTARQLLDELRAAHTIIGNALAVMTTEEKLRWADLNERDGVDGEGITRANERMALIERSQVSQPPSETSARDRLGIRIEQLAALTDALPCIGQFVRGKTVNSLQFLAAELASDLSGLSRDAMAEEHEAALKSDASETQPTRG